MILHPSLKKNSDASDIYRFQVSDETRAEQLGMVSVSRTDEKPIIRVGLIGAGFMGKAHCIGFGIAERVFELPVQFDLHMVADVTLERAEAARLKYGFKRATDNWRDAVADNEIDLIDISVPNSLHKEIALAAIDAGKHVYCEKPLAPTAQDAADMAAAARRAGVITQVGFNYLSNPMIMTARDMIANGELGDIHSYRGVHAEDYMSNPLSAWSFRHEKLGGGALADIGSHALATAEFLLGPIQSVMGKSRTVFSERRDAANKVRKVEADDVTHALVEFASGATGSISANWVATGRKMQHDFEVFGSKGSLAFSQERLNELHYYSVEDRSGRRGYRRIEAGPEHAPYGDFCMAPGHQIGFNDLKAIEILGYANALAGKAPEAFGFRQGAHIQALVGAIEASSRLGRWITMDGSHLRELGSPS